MSEQENRSYNDFSLGAIYQHDGQTPSLEGWLNDELGNTPINADNLNAMLQMLIDIRNVIGKTTDFAININGQSLTPPDQNSTIIEGQINTGNTVATYIKAVADAIIGKGDNADNTEIDKTLSGLKSYLESLNVSEISEESHWAKSITQINGQIAVEYTQPAASDILYSSTEDDINIKNQDSVDAVVKALDKIIGDLSNITYSETAVSSVSEALTAEKNARETSDNTLQEKIDQEVLDREDAVSSVSEALTAEIDELAGEGRTTETIKANADAVAALKTNYESELALLKAADAKNENSIAELTRTYNEKVLELETADKANSDAIADINNKETGIKATIIGTDEDTAESDTIKGAKKYTDMEIETLRSLILEGLDEINCGTAAELIDNGGTN